MTLSLFERPRALEWDFFADMPAPGDPDGLTYYQREAVDSTFRKFEEGANSVLVVMATGLGKSKVYAAIAKRWWDRFHGSVLLLAHRNELVTQGRDHMEDMLGQFVEVEKAEMCANEHARFVAGSVQSFNKKRLERMGRDRFSLVICDEGHHFVSPTFKRAATWFNAKMVGLTATPDRADEKALGQVFDEVGYCMDIEDGITSGYLVPVHGQVVTLDEIDLSGVEYDKKKKDLAEGQLDEAMLKAGEAIPREVVRLFPGRAALVFAPGVKSAEYMAEKFNQLVPGSAIFIHAKTPLEDRVRMVADFKAGKHLYFCNVGIATEGFDAPDVSMVVMARPTTSRSLYAQMAGRATRAPKGVFAIWGKEQAEARRALIAASDKPSCMILDFVGNSGKHSLVTTEDLLGGNYSEEEVKAARKLKEKKPDSDARENLRLARSQLQAIAAAAQARVKSTIRSFDPFACYGVEMSEEQKYAVRFGHKAASIGQLTALEHMGMEASDMKDLSYKAARVLLDEWRNRKSAGLATFKQVRALRKFGIEAKDVTFDNAKRGLDYLANTKWGRETDMKKLDEILHHARQMGED